MGINRMGIPQETVLFLKKETKSECFIETGTYYGETTKWASNHFDKVYTIENSETIFKEVQPILSDFKNIESLFGHSKDVLTNIIGEINTNTIYWLDAHWCSGESYGKNDQCPLIEELEIINQQNAENSILIDDARLFLSPPPLPNDFKQYPNIDEIIRVLNKNNNRFVAVFEDVIIAIPIKYKNEVQSFLQKLATKNWRNYGIELKKKKSFIYRHTDILLNKLYS